MKEESKYYTPTIEEFHVGFELEIKLHELKPWEKHIWLPGDQASSVEKYLDKIRVKLLDKEDIESLGFEEEFIPDVYNEDDELKLGYVLKIDRNKSINLHLKENNLVTIYKQIIYNEVSGNWVVNSLFAGKIKNKSELQKILKMVL